jgi:hypothetical protein
MTPWLLTPWESLGPLSSAGRREHADLVFAEDPRVIDQESTTIVSYQSAGVRLFFDRSERLVEIEVLRRSEFVVEVARVLLRGSASSVAEKLEHSGIEISRNNDPTMWFADSIGVAWGVPLGGRRIDGVAVRFAQSDRNHD